MRVLDNHNSWKVVIGIRERRDTEGEPPSLYINSAEISGQPMKLVIHRVDCSPIG